MTDQERKTMSGQRRKVYAPHSEERRTKQSLADGMSIHEQLKRYANMGLVPSGGGQPRYGDFSGMDDYQEALLRVREAEAEFLRLPAAVRKVADNDPGKFLEMVYGGRADLLEEMVRGGLARVHMPEGVTLEGVQETINKANAPPAPPQAPPAKPEKGPSAS